MNQDCFGMLSHRCCNILPPIMQQASLHFPARTPDSDEPRCYGVMLSTFFLVQVIGGRFFFVFQDSWGALQQKRELQKENRPRSVLWAIVVFLVFYFVVLVFGPSWYLVRPVILSVWEETQASAIEVLLCHEVLLGLRSALWAFVLFLNIGCT